MTLRPQDLLSHEPTLWFRLWFINRTIFLGHKLPQTFYAFDVEFPFKMFSCRRHYLRDYLSLCELVRSVSNTRPSHLFALASSDALV